MFGAGRAGRGPSACQLAQAAEIRMHGVTSLCHHIMQMGCYQVANYMLTIKEQLFEGYYSLLGLMTVVVVIPGGSGSDYYVRIRCSENATFEQLTGSLTSTFPNFPEFSDKMLEFEKLFK